MAHRRVKRLGEQEPDPDPADAIADLPRRQIDAGAEGFEDVGRPRLRGSGAVAVLGDHDAAGRGDQCRGSRYVERVLAVAAGAAGIDVVLAGDLERQSRPPHGAGQSGHLVGGLALHSQGGDERSELGRFEFTGHDLVHDRFGFGSGQVLAPVDLGQHLGDHARGPIR